MRTADAGGLREHHDHAALREREGELARRTDATGAIATRAHRLTNEQALTSPFKNRGE
jgi:hypothetical protein